MLKIILAPLLGAVIGFLTNDLAIRMLFHPRRPIFIGKYQLPFTPGLIPKQKERIAASIGRVVSRQLLNSDTLRETFLSAELLEHLRETIQRWVDGFAEDNRTVRETLLEYVEPEKLEEYQNGIQAAAVSFLMQKLLEAQLGSYIVDVGVQAVLRAAPILSGALNEKRVDSIKASVSGRVDDLIREKAPAFLGERAEQLGNSALDLKLSELYAMNQKRIPELVEHVVSLYQNILENNLEKLLAAVNVEQIIVQKVNSFEAEQLEALLFGIMKRELQAIVYLGAALGFVMGFLSLLF